MDFHRRPLAVRRTETFCLSSSSQWLVSKLQTTAVEALDYCGLGCRLDGETGGHGPHVPRPPSKFCCNRMCRGRVCGIKSWLAQDRARMDDGALWAATTFCPIQRQNSSVLPYVVIVSRTETNKEPPELYRRRCLRRIVADGVLIGGYLLLHLADEDTKDTKVPRVGTVYLAVRGPLVTTARPRSLLFDPGLLEAGGFKEALGKVW